MSEVGNCVMPHGSDSDGTPRFQRIAVGYLCQRHRDRMDTDTSEIATLWCELNLVIDGSAPREASPKTRHTKSAEAPAPLDLTAVALRDPRTHAARISATQRNPDGDQSEPLPAVPHIVASWVLLVADERPLTDALPNGVVSQLALLARHHDWIAAQGWVDDYLLELAELRKALRQAVHDVTHERLGSCDLGIEQPVPCACYCHVVGSASCTVDQGMSGKPGVKYCGPHSMTLVACGGSLIRENGSSVVRCSRCRQSWVTDQERARLALRLDGSST